jgi:TfdA family taurine catabolism dioxygenase TauD
MYKSLTAQTLHYFARPHRDVRRTPIGGVAAWRAADVARPDAWRITLDAAQVEDIERALAHANATGKALGTLTRDDFPLPRLTRAIATWRDEVAHGRGFVVVRGVPVARWPARDAETFFFCLGMHLGVPGAQNPQGDLLGHVRDTGADPRHVRAYRTASNIAYHCDAADLVGLLCLNEAKSGGASRIVSSVAVYDELLARRPDLVDRLYEPFLLDTHGEGGVDWVPVRACRHARGRLRTFWHSDYFRSSHGYLGAPPLSGSERETLDLYDSIAASPSLYLDMDLEPGDIQLLSNHTILHARTAYEDHPEPERKRHLLRLWVSLDTEAPDLGERASRLRSLASMIANVARARARRAMRGRAQRA